MFKNNFLFGLFFLDLFGLYFLYFFFKIIFVFLGNGKGNFFIIFKILEIKSESFF